MKALVREHIFEAERYFKQCHASTLVVLDNDDVVAAWFGGTHEKHPDVAIWSARRHNGKWEAPVKIADKENAACWNPVLHKAPDGKLHLYYKVGEEIEDWYTMVITSADNGYSWTQPEEIVKDDTGGRGPVKNKIIVLKDGTWLAPASIETPHAWDSFVDMSMDGGRAWHKSSYVPIDHSALEGKGIIQPTLWESHPGRVHMLLRSTEGCIYRSDSADSGATWCTAYPIQLPNNNSGIDVARMENGNLVLVYNPVTGNWAGRTPLVCSLSTDNGMTWRQNYILDHNEAPADRTDGEFSYPAVVAMGNHVYITYTWKRTTIAFQKLEVPPD